MNNQYSVSVRMSCCDVVQAETHVGDTCFSCDMIRFSFRGKHSLLPEQTLSSYPLLWMGRPEITYS